MEVNNHFQIMVGGVGLDLSCRADWGILRLAYLQSLVTVFTVIGKASILPSHLFSLEL